jgi:hypothetical protein
LSEERAKGKSARFSERPDIRINAKNSKILNINEILKDKTKRSFSLYVPLLQNLKKKNRD